MKQFKNILLRFECDQATLTRAAELAVNNQARLTVVQVIKKMPEVWQHTLGDTPLDLQKLAISEIKSRLNKFIAPLKTDGVNVTAKVLVGTQFLEIIREVIANKHDLVMMTAEGKGGLKERLFGSTSQHLMRKCPCPVWVMKPTRRKHFKQILAAVDPDPTDQVRDSLNVKIVELASSLAAQENARLHIAHAWTLLAEPLLRSRGLYSEAEINDCVSQEKNRHQKMLDDLLAKHMSYPASIHMNKGNADWLIPRIAKTKKIDLLLMGTVCRTGIPGFFIGNTAEKILDEIDCSVLTVKPDGFVSPVKLA